VFFVVASAFASIEEIRLMVKLSFVLRRLPSLSREEFQRYWRDTHGPLVRQRAAALRIRRYLQLHTLTNDPVNDALQASRGGLPPYDGVAELWWHSTEDLAAALATPAGQQASRELFVDEQRFIDHAHSSLWIGEEHVFVGEPST
jgi:uncharacterized protein (TIGR02118 family)